MISICGINRNVERQVALFEEALAQAPETRFREYLLAAGHEDYSLVAIELMRVDLELAWSRGARKRIDEYEKELPQLFTDADVRRDLAFEEFRARQEQGEHVDAAEYETKYQVDTSLWSLFSPPNSPPNLAAGSPATETPETLEMATSEAGTLETRLAPDLADIGFPSSPTELPGVGDDWGPFQIVDELGRGTIATTFLAKQPGLANRLVALKFSTVVTTEADKLARLQHTNVVPVYSIHQDATWQVTCMPFLGRTTLSDVVSHPQILNEVTQEGGSMTREHSVLSLVMALAKGLGHAHSRGILHRDVKPANILLADDGEPMLLDFNLSVDRFVDHPKRGSSVFAGGTVPYMAPEHLRSLDGDGEPDERSDIYSLGVVLYQLLTGKLPWRESQHDVETRLGSILTERAALALPHIHEFSPAVTQIVAKCLAPDVGQRYASADALATDIDQHLHDRPLIYGRNVSARELVTKWAKRHPRICSMATAAVLLGVGAIAMATAWMAREEHVAAVRATEVLQSVDRQLTQLRPALHTVGWHPELRSELRESAAQLAIAAGLAPDASTDNSRFAQSLTAEQRERWETGRIELAYLQAHLELLAAQTEPDEARRRELASSARTMNQIAAQLDSDSAAIDRQRRAIDRVLGAVSSGAAKGGVDDTIEASDLQRASAAPKSALDHRLMSLVLAFDNPDEAIEQVREAVRLAPTDPAAWLLLVQTHLNNQDYSKAEAQAEVTIALLPDSPWPWFQRGMARLQSEQFKAAAEDFSVVLDLDSGQHRARMNLALALKSLGQFVESEQQLSLAIDGGFADPRAHLIRSRVRSALGDKSGAQADIEDGLDLPALDAAGYLAKGIVLVARAPQEALGQFRACLDVRPDNAAAWHNMAHVQSEKLGDAKAAIESLGNAIRLNASDTRALAGRGVLHAREKNAAKALRDAKQLESLPLDPTTEYQLACIYALIVEEVPTQEARALQLLARSVARDPALVAIAATDPDMKSLNRTQAFQAIVDQP